MLLPLVVLGVILSLFAYIMWVKHERDKRDRELNIREVCHSQLLGTAQALQDYLAQHKGVFPGRRGAGDEKEWFRELRPLIEYNKNPGTGYDACYLGRERVASIHFDVALSDRNVKELAGRPDAVAVYVGDTPAGRDTIPVSSVIPR